MINLIKRMSLFAAVTVFLFKIADTIFHQKSLYHGNISIINIILFFQDKAGRLRQGIIYFYS